VEHARLGHSGCPARTPRPVEHDLDALTQTLPQALKVALCKLLARSRAERFQAAGETAAALRGWLGASFGAKKAAEELETIAEKGADRLAELDVPRRKTARST
jgi:hypothetical protein